MQKDVIYIDTEDDITAIIGKVKDSTGKVVALVPPKRIGAIQSAVNLKLVHRAAESAKKHLVIVTNNHALSALAGSAGIPVAKNLESRPEMPEISALEVDDEDIIDGNELPVGDHAKVAEATADEDIEDKGAAAAGVVGATALAAANEKVAAGRNAIAATAAKARTKVPNFDTFRKKLFIGIAAFLLLVSLLVWAIVFAPQAVVIIKAKTSDTALNSKVSVGPSVATSLKDGSIKAEVKTITKDVSVPFTATGKKEVGEKATGTVKFTPTSPSVYLNGATIPAGTQVASSGGSAYLTDQAVVFDSDAPASSLAAGKTVSVTAAARGSAYNGASGQATGPAGFSTSFTSPTSGGTDKTVTVVQQGDVDTVSGDIVKTNETEAAKKSLGEQFGSDYILIEETFKADSSSIAPSPAVGQEATDGKAALTGKLSYSMVAVAKSEASKYLDAYFAQQIDGKSNQSVYDNGIKAVDFTSPVVDEDKTIVTIATNGKIGPKIDEAEVKEYAKGKKAGEIKVYVESVSGVESADISFSPFWVTAAPGDVNKIKVEFKLDG